MKFEQNEIEFYVPKYRISLRLYSICRSRFFVVPSIRYKEIDFNNDYIMFLVKNDFMKYNKPILNDTYNFIIGDTFKWFLKN